MHIINDLSTLAQWIGQHSDGAIRTDDLDAMLGTSTENVVVNPT